MRCYRCNQEIHHLGGVLLVLDDDSLLPARTTLCNLCLVLVFWQIEHDRIPGQR